MEIFIYGILFLSIIVFGIVTFKNSIKITKLNKTLDVSNRGIYIKNIIENCLNNNHITIPKSKLQRSNHGDNPCLANQNIKVHLYSNDITLKKNGKII